MKKLLEEISAAVENELERAEAKFSKFNSGHEGYAIILEEFEEALDMVEEAKLELHNIWQCVKKDNLQSKEYAANLIEIAKKASAEFAQVAAMGKRFKKDVE